MAEIVDIETHGPLKLKAKIFIPESNSQVPALFSLHGIGEVGTNLNLVMKYGPLQQLEAGVYTGKPKVIIHPQNPSSTWSIAEVDEVVEYLRTLSIVKQNQISGMGMSLGGLGLWNYVQSPDHAKKLACFVPICGGGNDPNKAINIVNERIPGWAAHAKNDTVVNYTVTKRMVDAVNSMAGASQILFSEYGIYGHGAWNYFLRPEYHVYDWIDLQDLARRKVPVTYTGSININWSANISPEGNVNLKLTS
jgi:predicted peptidase